MLFGVRLNVQDSFRVKVHLQNTSDRYSLVFSLLPDRAFQSSVYVIVRLSQPEGKRHINVRSSVNYMHRMSTIAVYSNDSNGVCEKLF